MRPTYRNSLRLDRVLNLSFYTSNIAKFLQARLIFSRYGLTVSQFRGAQEPYSEDYSLGTEGLLRKAISQITSKFNINSVFFIEDTSLRIEALSEAEDYPGVRVKDWFSEVTFEELDRTLLLRGNDRRCTVKSDIALHIPGASGPIFFHGQSSGTIAATKPDFEPSIQYPWLTPATFNGWFVPNGSDRRLGEMEFEESLRFDFRVKAFVQLIERLSEFNAVANLPPRFFENRNRATAYDRSLPLIAGQDRVLIVIGFKCAGKSTFGDFVSKLDGSLVLEASTILRGIAEEAGVQIENGDSARAFLQQQGMDCVARRAVDYFRRIDRRVKIITGLRTIEEIYCISQEFPEAEIVFVETDPRIRFERHVRRARQRDVRTFREFEMQNEEEAAFGALRVAKYIADVVITNDYSIDLFNQKISDLLRGRRGNDYEQRKKVLDSELQKCLEALAAIGRAATCEEISQMTAQKGSIVRKYNTNRALKEVPELAQRVERPKQLLRYRLLPAGRVFLELLRLRASTGPIDRPQKPVA